VTEQCCARQCDEFKLLNKKLDCLFKLRKGLILEYRSAAQSA
jgi:hypothetical protein